MLDSYKVCLCFIALWVTVCAVGYICLFCGDQIFVYFVSFLFMIIYKVLYTWCLRYNILSTWLLDIRILTCSIRNYGIVHDLVYIHVYCSHVLFYVCSLILFKGLMEAHILHANFTSIAKSCVLYETVAYCTQCHMLCTRVAIVGLEYEKQTFSTLCM